MLDLFAYNEDAYGMWVSNIGSLASDNSRRGLKNLNLKNQSRTKSRPSSSHGRYSRATVVPSDNLTNEASSFSAMNSKLNATKRLTSTPLPHINQQCTTGVSSPNQPVRNGLQTQPIIDDDVI